MSQPKRFEVQLHEMGASIFPHYAGRFVEYSDYAALAAENKRLRKAGDAMAESINYDDQRTWEDWGNQGKSLLRDCVIDWIIAKRGDEK